jgi:GntR family transcriptional regulator, transcriptional repressor for pyruvate dehydrogenase complex
MQSETLNTARVHPPGLTRSVCDDIRQGILSGSLSVGEKLPSEQELAKRYNASCSTIRDALKILSLTHFVRSKRGPSGGTFVNRPSLSLVHNLAGDLLSWLVTLNIITHEDLAETRGVLSSAWAKLAAQRRTESNLKELELSLRRMSNNSLPNQIFCAANSKFHENVAVASGNKTLGFIARFVLKSLLTAEELVVFSFQEREALVEYNLRIFQAIQARQADTAQAENEELLTYLARLVDASRRLPETRMLATQRY